ncbi:hypothetical protein RJ640_011411 [Escallonia rubra]|uniref:SMP domain-containing protein n=1 Tax=Escallonia rubra TaxID=112253 RepID=A0AA88R761_9ASTE|nr:hypothetical protein RJ640_011411 [Escallonia rubra]
MSQDQPRRRRGDQQQEPIKYGDVFRMSGDVADQTVAPRDAALMQSAETTVMGQTQRGGPAATMQSAADRNVRAGFVGHGQASDVAVNQGVAITETDLPGGRIITESVAGRVVGQYVEPAPVVEAAAAGVDVRQTAITIGEALEAAIHTAGNKPVDQSDAAAIRAAETRATGVDIIMPGGLAAAALSAATFNQGLTRDEDKVKLNDILTDATAKLPADKPATREDAEGVTSAEIRNNPNMTTHPGGVAASISAAARLNEGAGAVC